MEGGQMRTLVWTHTARPATLYVNQTTDFLTFCVCKCIVSVCVSVWEGMCECIVRVWVYVWVCVSVWVCKCMWEWECMCECMYKCILSVCDCVCKCIVSVCECVCAPLQCACGNQKVWVGNQFSPSTLWVSGNIGCLAWLQASLPTEPSCQP